MTTFLQAGIICCAALLLTAMLTVPAEARIQCRGNFQMTKYGPIATPYCEEEQIAFVARSYGQNVTGSQVRKKPIDEGVSLPDAGLGLAAEGILRWIRSGLLRPGPLTLFGRGSAVPFRRPPPTLPKAPAREMARFAV